VHVREPVVAALEFERQPSVVDAEAMQHRRVQVMNMHRVARNVVAEVLNFGRALKGAIRKAIRCRRTWCFGLRRRRASS
jgi:hypothetical protein